MAESFNATMVLAREKHALTMLEDSMVYLMSRRAIEGNILPRIRRKVEKRARAAGQWHSYWFATKKYEARKNTQNMQRIWLLENVSPQTSKKAQEKPTNKGKAKIGGQPATRPTNRDTKRSSSQPTAQNATNKRIASI
ncbi:hypothetical protein PIB30_002958 [Stylosanthes scabra]|uniref:Uncharacterized protein n=1 Tax=Stylosanthes scabra TaxID=79078 RepID=A0ABU6V208_9FABA|nr:hypothetical protein [Stylosanthes scabra]